jgi:competence protein ComEA
MATKGERQALLFLAAVALLGAGTRWYRSRRPAVDAASVDHQLAALDSVQIHGRGRKPKFGRPQAPRADTTTAPAPTEKVDLDFASAGTIERLPGVGPALARRIARNRDSSGTFGCLAALDAVKGIGPAMLKRLDSLVTFTGPPRAACLGGSPPAGGEDQHEQQQDGDRDHGSSSRG